MFLFYRFSRKTLITWHIKGHRALQQITLRINIRAKSPALKTSSSKKYPKVTFPKVIIYAQGEKYYLMMTYCDTV